MTRTVVDSASFNGSIANTSTESLTVKTADADTLLILVDDTTEGGAPASYDWALGVETREANAYQELDSATASTATSFEKEAYGRNMSFDLTNQSGAGANYQITVVAYK